MDFHVWKMFSMFSKVTEIKFLPKGLSSNKPASAWWRHQMKTFSALLAICAENSPVPGEFSTQRPVTRSFDVYFDLRPNKGLSKQLWGWWFETQSCPLWRHRNVNSLAPKRPQAIHYLNNRRPWFSGAFMCHSASHRKQDRCVPQHVGPIEFLGPLNMV